MYRSSSRSSAASECTPILVNVEHDDCAHTILNRANAEYQDVKWNWKIVVVEVRRFFKFFFSDHLLDKNHFYTHRKFQPLILIKKN